jgi:hypothetical protein
MLGNINRCNFRLFPKNVFLVAMDSAHYRVVDDLEWLRPSASHSEETPGSSLRQQTVTRKGRVSCEVNSIGATGVGPLLLGRTTICIGTRIGQPAQTHIMNGSDYAGLPSSLLWPYQIVSIVDGQTLGVNRTAKTETSSQGLA